MKSPFKLSGTLTFWYFTSWKWWKEWMLQSGRATLTRIFNALHLWPHSKRFNYNCRYTPLRRVGNGVWNSVCAFPQGLAFQRLQIKESWDVKKSELRIKEFWGSMSNILLGRGLNSRPREFNSSPPEPSNHSATLPLKGLPMQADVSLYKLIITVAVN